MAPLAVIGAGCGRTGTLSLKAALEQLGFPCYHMREVVERGAAAQWHEALQHPEAADWDGIFAGFTATVDFPAATVYKELMARYPDAKVILSVRAPDTWAASVMETIWNPYARERSLVMAPWFPNFQRLGRAFRARFFRDADGGIASGAIDDPQRLAALFREWVDEVKSSVPADRLLVFEARDGWAPLCRFLGVPVPPDTPYPRVNDTAAFKQMTRDRWRRLALLDAALVAALSLGAGLLARRALVASARR